MKSIAISTMFFLYSLISVAASEFELKGIKIGTSFESMDLEVFNCKKSVLDKTYSECNSLDNFTLAGKPAEMRIEFYEGKAYTMSATFKELYYHDIVDAVVLKFGKPKSVSNRMLVNGFGVEYESKDVYWNNKHENIVIYQMLNSVDVSLISLSDNNEDKIEQKIKKKKVQESLNDM